MTCLAINFMATLWPVTVCWATENAQVRGQSTRPTSHRTCGHTSDFAESALGNVPEDMILAQLGSRVDLVLSRLSLRHRVIWGKCEGIEGKVAAPALVCACFLLSGPALVPRNSSIISPTFIYLIWVYVGAEHVSSIPKFQRNIPM
jgi:hypothetical protein